VRGRTSWANHARTEVLAQVQEDSHPMGARLHHITRKWVVSRDLVQQCRAVNRLPAARWMASGVASSPRSSPRPATSRVGLASGSARSRRPGFGPRVRVPRVWAKASPRAPGHKGPDGPSAGRTARGTPRAVRRGTESCRLPGACPWLTRLLSAAASSRSAFASVIPRDSFDNSVGRSPTHNAVRARTSGIGMLPSLC